MSVYIPTILGIDGVNLSNSEMPLFNSVVRDDDARVLRADIAPGVTAAAYAIVQIDNRLNNIPVYFRAWDEAAPVVGTTPPALILRCNPGRVTEYYMTAQCDKYSYQVVTTPGKAGADIPANAVPVVMAMQLQG